MSEPSSGSFPPVEGAPAPAPVSSRRPDAGPPGEYVDDSVPSAPTEIRWQRNLALFAATVVTVFMAGAQYTGGSLLSGWTFAVPLLLILLFHEFGHWIAARIHRVDASLPFFIPLPYLSPFGTMGAVIAMRGRIRSRNALLDIGAAGPLAGMVVAVPVMIIGLYLSAVKPVSPGFYIQEGQGLLYLALKRLVVGPIPAGHDVFLHPTAMAGWAGFLVTMINMLPWGQLDGGHIAYALFGPRQNHFAKFVRYALIPLFLFNLAKFLIPIYSGASQMPLGLAISNSSFWIVWFFVTFAIGRFSGREHPPTDDNSLSPGRRWLAAGTLLMFVLLFMPTPWAVYTD